MNETRKGEWTRAQIGRLGTGASPQFTRLEGQGSRAPNLVRSLCGVALPRAWKGDVVPDTTHSALGHTAPTRAPSSTGRLGGRPAARGAQQPGAPSSEGRRASRSSPGPAPGGWRPSRCGCAAACTRGAEVLTRTGRRARRGPGDHGSPTPVAPA